MAVAEQAVQAVKNFAFHEELVRVVVCDARPWFVAVDVCRSLQIKNVTRAVDRLPHDAVALHTVKGDGPERTVNIISEGGLYRLVFTSRTPQAEEFVTWVADVVLPAIRENGFYGRPAAVGDLGSPAGDRANPDTFMAKVQCIRECRLVFGRPQAQIMWRQLGLPAVPPPPMTEVDEASICLRYLLDTAVQDACPAIRDVLEQALDEDENARALLIGAGIRPLPERDAFLIANSHPRLAQIFDGTDWVGRHGRVLRRLPGIVAGNQHRYGDHMQRRGSLVPASYLDPVR